MRYRISGPEPDLLVPFYITFYHPPSRETLIALAKESAQQDRKPVLVAVGMDGTIFGGVHATDSHFENYPISSQSQVFSAYGEPGAELITGLPFSSLDEGILVIPISQNSKFYSLRLVLEHWANCPLGQPEAGQWEGSVLVWGHYVKRRFCWPKYVVDIYSGATVKVHLPEYPDDLKEYFSALATELKLSQCWVLHGDKIYHLQW